MARLRRMMTMTEVLRIEGLMRGTCNTYKPPCAECISVQNCGYKSTPLLYTCTQFLIEKVVKGNVNSLFSTSKTEYQKPSRQIVYLIEFELFWRHFLLNFLSSDALHYSSLMYRTHLLTIKNESTPLSSSSFGSVPTIRKSCSHHH